MRTDFYVVSAETGILLRIEDIEVSTVIAMQCAESFKITSGEKNFTNG